MRLLVFLFLGLFFFSCKPDASLQKPIFKAIKENDLKTLREEAADKAKINMRSEKDELTPLMYAAHKGRVEATRLLLELGADANLQDVLGNSALHHSTKAFRNNLEIAKALLEAKATMTLKNTKGHTPWAKVFAEDVGTLAKDEQEFLLLLLKNGYCPDPKTSNHATWLHEIADKADVAALADLLITQCKLEVDAEDENGWTPLHFASRAAHGNIVSTLLQHGANPNAQTRLAVGDKSSKAPHSYIPAGQTPLDMYYKARTSKMRANIRPILEAAGGKRSEELGE